MTDKDSALTAEHENLTESRKAMKSYEVSDLREQKDVERSDWMTKLLLNKEFQMVPATNLQAIFAKLESMTFKAGESVISQGAVGKFFFVITAGRCEVTRDLPMNRGSVKLAELGVGDTFGEEALITDATRQATVTMLEDGAVMRLSKEDFKKLLSEPIVSVLSPKEAQTVIDEGGNWLNVDFAENHEQPDPENMVRVPTYLLRLKLDQLNENLSYVVVSRKHSHACAAAHILQQSGFDVYVRGKESQEDVDETVASVA